MVSMKIEVWPGIQHSRRCEDGGREVARLAHRCRLAVALLVALTEAGAARADTGVTSLSCDGSPRANEPSRDLYCIELFPHGDGERVGSRRAGPRCGPFTSRRPRKAHCGTRRRSLLAGLPAPSSLGRYAVYVVWAATPSMDRVRRLGVATAGRTRLAVIDFDKFVILVSAERSASVREPLGRIVLRGMSASTRLRPPGADPSRSARCGMTTPAWLACRDGSWPRHARRRCRGGNFERALDDGPDAAGADDAAGGDGAPAGRAAVPASRRIRRAAAGATTRARASR